MRTCPQCDADFEPKRANQRYCSHRCRWTRANRNRKLRPNTFFECQVCGVDVARYVEPSKLASGQATAEYCSLQCKGAALSGENHPLWKGGRCVVNGYVWVYCPEHPNAKHQGYVLEHRLVMEKHLGRHLTREEVVHHENEDTQDNRIENLKLYASNSEHKKVHEPNRRRDALGHYLPLHEEDE